MYDGKLIRKILNLEEQIKRFNVIDRFYYIEIASIANV